jgi:hypothetical protein
MEIALSVYHWRIPYACFIDKKCKIHYNDVRINVNIVLDYNMDIKKQNYVK